MIITSTVNPYKYPAIGLQTTVPDQVFDFTTFGWANYAVRQLIDASLIQYSGSSIQVKFHAQAAGEGIAFSSVYVGHQASSGDVYDFDGNQVQLLFGGSGSVTVAAGTTQTSDEVDFDLDSTKNLIVSMGVANDSNNDTFATYSSSDYTVYWKAAAAGEAGTTDVTGYGTNNSISYSVGEIKTNSDKYGRS